MEQQSDTSISVYFLALTCLFVTCLLITNIVAGRLVDFRGITLTADLFLFPITYIFGDVLTEVYGFRRARITIWMGFAANLFMSLVFILIISLPHPAFWHEESAYHTVLGFTPRVVAASLAAYFLGEFSNSVILSRMKILTEGKWLWTRTIGSTLVGEGVDTLVFMSIAFTGMYARNIFISMVLAQYFWKVGYEILATPLTYLIVNWLKKKENVNTYDRGIRYNPFAFRLR